MGQTWPKKPGLGVCQLVRLGLLTIMAFLFIFSSFCFVLISFFFSFLFLSFFFFFFRDMVPLCSPGCCRTHSVDHSGLELKNPPACFPSAQIQGVHYHTQSILAF